MVEALAGQQDASRRPAARDEREPADRPRVDGEAQAGGGQPEHAGLVDDAQVGGERELRAGADRGPVHRGHDGHRHLREPVQHAVERGEEVGVADGVEVRAGAERRALAA